MRILHVINGLHVGGAETMLCRLIKAAGPAADHAAVVSVINPGPLARRLEEMGVPVYSLGLSRSLPHPRAVGRLWSTFRGLSGDLVQGWMYHGNLVGSLGARIVKGRQPVIWNIRHSLHDIKLEKPITASLIRLGARLSRTPRAIIYNSATSARQHEELGYDRSRSRVIPNGLDCEQFKPRPEERQAVRRQVGFPEQATVIGMIARSHPMKNTDGLLRSLAALSARGRDFHLLLVGRGHDGADLSLVARIRDLGLTDRVTLLGERHDVAALMSALDLLVLPSLWGEGFPNVLAETMASGVPCVTTDIGDSAHVVGEHGIVVPPGDIEALAAGIERLAALGAEERAALGQAARASIRDRFSIDEIRRRYEELYAETLNVPLPAEGRSIRHA